MKFRKSEKRMREPFRKRMREPFRKSDGINEGKRNGEVCDLGLHDRASERRMVRKVN